MLPCSDITNDTKESEEKKNGFHEESNTIPSSALLTYLKQASKTDINHLSTKPTPKETLEQSFEIAAVPSWYWLCFCKSQSI